MYALYKITFYDKHNQCYKNIIQINSKPLGPLQNRIQKIHLPKLSPFKTNDLCCNENRCVYAIINNNKELMSIDELPKLFEFLVLNNYKIDTSVTKMMNQSKVQLSRPLICFISYQN